MSASCLFRDRTAAEDYLNKLTSRSAQCLPRLTNISPSGYQGNLSSHRDAALAWLSSHFKADMTFCSPSLTV